MDFPNFSIFIQFRETKLNENIVKQNTVTSTDPLPRLRNDSFPENEKSIIVKVIYGKRFNLVIRFRPTADLSNEVSDDKD